MVKATFTLDDLTVARLRRAGARLSKPLSQVVREAIHDYADRIGKLSEQERLRLLRVFDTLVPEIPTRPVRQVEQELKTLRAARRHGGRRRRASGS